MTADPISTNVLLLGVFPFLRKNLANFCMRLLNVGLCTPLGTPNVFYFNKMLKVKANLNR